MTLIAALIQTADKEGSVSEIDRLRS